MLVQSISVFSLAVFLWALLPEIKLDDDDDDDKDSNEQTPTIS